MRHRVIAGSASVAGMVGAILLMAWMVWRYPGGPGGWRAEGSPPQWWPIIATILVITSGGVVVYGVACERVSERRSGEPHDAPPEPRAELRPGAGGQPPRS